MSTISFLVFLMVSLTGFSTFLHYRTEKYRIQDGNAINLLVKQNITLSEQINVLRVEIEVLAHDMEKILEENHLLNREVNMLTEELSRLQSRIRKECDPVGCEHVVRFQ